MRTLATTNARTCCTHEAWTCKCICEVSSRGCVDRELLRDLMEELNGGQRCKMVVDAAAFSSHVPILPLSVPVLRIHGACGSGMGAVPGCSEHAFGTVMHVWGTEASHSESHRDSLDGLEDPNFLSPSAGQCRPRRS